MISSQLLTNYVLAPIWVKTLLFICFYFILLNLFLLELDYLAICENGEKQKTILESTEDTLVRLFCSDTNPNVINSETVIKNQQDIIKQQQKDLTNAYSLLIGITILFVFYSFR